MSSTDTQRWLQMWRDDKTDFHQQEVDHLLKRYWLLEEAQECQKVFVPMCGKSHDLLWLAAQGMQVVGVELSPVAVKAFFNENGLSPERKRIGHFTVWTSENITLYCGDYFQLTAADLIDVDIVYDRAALTALPEPIRLKYIQHMFNILPGLQQVFLLTTEDCDSHQRSLPDIDAEITSLYSSKFSIEMACSEAILSPQESDFKSYLKLYKMQLNQK